MNKFWHQLCLHKIMRPILIILFSVFFSAANSFAASKDIVIVGAEQPLQYLEMVGKSNIAVVANQTSKVGSMHLVDFLLKKKVNVKLVFGPEHGFRGEAEAGELVNSSVDKTTGLKVVSLYGNHKKPTKEDLKGIDMVVFDIQDVGVRFYTYISTLQYVMEACAENKLTLVILDRPNPNGFYIDGPVLNEKYKSFVGMQTIPVVHGMTIAEYAQMLNGEGWLDKKVNCNLKIVKVQKWTHYTPYFLSEKPSPNLPNQTSIYLYPSLCLFEGTNVSVGRGTDFPFQVYGYPNSTNGTFEFTPQSIPGVSKTPLHEGKKCIGFDLRRFAPESRKSNFNISWLIEAYKTTTDTSTFFNSFFDKLAGDSKLREQIIAGVSEKEIRDSWKQDLNKFMAIRKKYLLYKDFN
jgi:uncharacterized protein YbbC (DUF1343 family)